MTVIQAFVPSVRPALLRALLTSWRAYGRYPLHIHAQRAPRAEWDALAREFSDLRLTWTFSETGGPVWPIRTRAVLGAPEVDVWVHLDDDMELLPETDYRDAIEKTLEPGVGVVSCNWVRSESPGFRARAWPPGKTLWIRQPIVNMSGGMIYHKRLAPEFAKVRDVPFLLDDVQVGLCAYLAGYENWRFRGSLAIHRILSPGGIKVVNGEQRHALPDSLYLRSRLAKDQSCPISAHNIYMPVASDLTPEAHRQHKRARAALGL